MLGGFDNTSGIVRESGVSSIFIFYYPIYFCFVFNTFSFLAQACSQISDEHKGLLDMFWRFPSNKESGKI